MSSSMGSLSGALSALMSSQTALNTTAHNLTNVDTEGYTRQQVLLTDNSYNVIGNTATSTMSVGNGTDIDTIRQVRDIYLDQSVREENGRLGYYEAQSDAINEIENIFGEIEGEAFSDVLGDFWTSMSELSKDPESLETRASFIQNAVLLVERANLIQEQLNDYQDNLNSEISATVDRINEIGEQINYYNDLISQSELIGGNANDYRDQRNLLLDELGSYADITYNEEADGTVMVNLEGVPFVIQGSYFEMSTTQAEEGSDLYVPYWEHLDDNVFDTGEDISSANDNDIGSLKGMVMAMGTRAANYTDLADSDVYEDEIEWSVVMQAQAQFDNLINGIVTMINDTVSPNTDGSPSYFDDASAPYGLEGTQGVEIFSRLYVDRYSPAIDADNPYDSSLTYEYNEEDSDDAMTLYSAGNLQVNPDVLADYDLLALSVNDGYYGDTTIMENMLESWDNTFSGLTPDSSVDMNYEDYYTAFIGDIGSLGSLADQQVETQELMVLAMESEQSELYGVSSDEELTNMMKYQYAYNSAARVIDTVDSMIEHVITSMGKVGR